MAYGTVCGWPSANFPVLLSNETPLASGPMTMDQISWVGSFMSIGSLFGNVFFGWMSERFGRKNSLLFSAIPQIVSD